MVKSLADVRAWVVAQNSPSPSRNVSPQSANARWIPCAIRSIGLIRSAWSFFRGGEFLFITRNGTVASFWTISFHNASPSRKARISFNFTAFLSAAICPVPMK